MKDLLFADKKVDGPFYAQNHVVRCIEIPSYVNTKKIGDFSFCVNWSKGVLDYNVAQNAFLVEEKAPSKGDFIFTPVEPFYVHITEENFYTYDDMACFVIYGTTDEKLRYMGVSGIGTSFLKAFCDTFEGVTSNQSLRENFINEYRGDRGAMLKFFNEENFVKQYSKEAMTKIFIGMSKELDLHYTTVLGVTVKLTEESIRKHLMNK